MEFTLNEEQKILRDSVARMAVDLAALPAPARRAKMADYGLLTLGLDPDEPMLLESMIVAEALGQSLVPDAFVMGQIGAASLLAASDLAPRFQPLLDQIAQGAAQVVPAMYEPGRRYDLTPQGTSRTKERLNGTKSIVMGADEATHLLISALDGAETVLLLLPIDAPGIACRTFTGIDGRGGAEITLTDVAVDANAIVRRGGAAETALAALADRVSAGLVADSVGAMTALMGITGEFLQTRKQFGRPIGTFQALQHRFVDMMLAHELARSMAIGAARALEALSGDARTQVIASARLQAAQSGRKIGEDAVQMHGAMGMTAEYPAGNFLKRLITNAALFGDADHHLDRLVALAQTERTAA